MPSAEPKLSDGRSISFRPGAVLRSELEKLETETGIRISDQLRAGLTAFWPDISALIRATGARRVLPPEELADLRHFAQLCRNARDRGIDPAATLAAALTASLADDARRSA